MNLNLSVISPPALEPVTLAEAKAHLRVTHSSEDTLITALIVAARQHVENYLRRALVTQTLEVHLADWYDAPGELKKLDCESKYSARIYLPRPPLQYVVSVKYLDGDEVLQTLSTSRYVEIAPTESVGYIQRAPDSTWPGHAKRDDAIRIRYVAGYEDVGSPSAGVGGVPQAIKQAILLVVGDLFENREAQAEKALSENRTVLALLAPFKDWYA